MVPCENCPKSCKGHTFHYCGESGTHCDKHCVCTCQACTNDRVKPMPTGTSGGKVLPGANVIGCPAGPLGM
jgi:hypothetical protein